jgi:bifunctional non-homologous end joining protein LigD
MANQNCITLHVWPSRTPKLYQPDVCVVDLDPSEDDLKVLNAAAVTVRDVLAQFDLPSWIKTSGSKGYHIVVPLDAKDGFDEVSAAAEAIGKAIVERDPKHFTQQFMKADREGKIYVDTGRNGYSATFAAAYALRSRAGAPVSAPCTWDEVESGEVNPRTFTLRNMAERVARVGDLWADMLGQGYSLRRAVV